MELKRRDLMGVGMGIGLTWAFLPIHVSMAKAEAGSGVTKTSNGKFTVYALSDGTVRRPLDAGFVRNANLSEVQAALAEQRLPTDHIMVPYTPFVVEANGKRFLMDTGFADNGPEGTGRLHENMRAAGIEPNTIDVILMSHLHGDHINGLRRKDGSLVYPDAKVFIPRPEYEHWMSEEKMNAAPEAAQGGFKTVRRVLQDYPQDRLEMFDPGKPVEGFETIAGFGHSPGQTAFSVGSGAESFTYLADVAHYPALFVRHPHWQVQFDMNPDVAQTTRHELLARMKEQGGLVGGYHFPFPSIGTIAAREEGYSFEAKA